MEIWKDIIGYEGLYKVSNTGKIKSLKYRNSHKEQILKERIQKGYNRTNLCKEGNKKQTYVHRLVAEAFIPNPAKLPLINHKDETRNNNNVDNLEWCTTSYNRTYGNARENQKKNTVKQVCQYDKEMNLIKIYKSLRSTGDDGFIPVCVSLCCHKKRKTHKKYTWRWLL